MESAEMQRARYYARKAGLVIRQCGNGYKFLRKKDLFAVRNINGVSVADVMTKAEMLEILDFLRQNVWAVDTFAD